MPGKATDWWGKLVVGLGTGRYEVLTENSEKDRVLIEIPGAGIFLIERFTP